MTEFEKRRMIESLEVNASLALLLKDEKQESVPRYEEYDPLSIGNDFNHK